MDSKEIIEAALSALERLMKMFAVERYVYLVLTAISFLLLLYAAYLMIASKGADTALLVAVFGSSGLVAVSSARITRFFNKSFTLIEDLIKRIST